MNDELLAVNVSCAECGLPTYVRGKTAAVECEMCGHEANWVDFDMQLDDDAELLWDDDGYLCVVHP